MASKTQPKATTAAAKNDTAELEALGVLYQTLKQFDVATRERMLAWLSSKLAS